MKRKLFLAISIAIVTLCAICSISCSKKNPKLVINCSASEGEICYGATGFLYGFSEDNVPDGDLLIPLNAKIAAVKAPNGLQHPVGDVLRVASTFINNGGQELFIYMQDIYPEWYYVYRGQEDYKEKVSQMMDELIASEYSDKFIYCPFNENDNGEWYGKFSKKDNRYKFYEDWRAIYEIIISKDPNAIIAGPGYCSYDKNYIKEFLSYCKDNNCLPSMMVWHELSSSSYKNYESNYATYRESEKEVGISPLRICISEYGRMRDNGVPGSMIQFISMFEKTKVDACIAYWRLANNLCEIAADNSTPAAAWWVYNWYANMKGNTYSVFKQDAKEDGFNGICAYDSEEGIINIIAGGEDGNGEIILNNISDFATFNETDEVSVEIEYVDYLGLGADCLAPTSLKAYKATISNNSLTINLDNMDASFAYNIKIHKNSIEENENTNTPNRYEAEDAKIEGVLNVTRDLSYKIKSKKLTYAASDALIKNIWDKDKELTFKINVNESGLYKISICYGNGYKTDSRHKASGYLSIDGNAQKIVLENTISQETTTTLDVYQELSQGEHKISLYKGDGEGNSVAFDFIDVEKIDSQNSEYRVNVIDDNHCFVIVDEAGYYNLEKDDNINDVFVSNINIASANNSVVYLKKGINIIKTDSNLKTIKISKNIDIKSIYLPILLNGNVNFEDNKYATNGKITTNASGVDNYISLSYNIESAGVYALNISYSSDVEIGAHSYNVQHVEQYAIFEVNGNKYTHYFRSTFSKDNFETKTIYLNLSAGQNEIKIYNDAKYIWNGVIPTMPAFNSFEIAKIKN